MINGPCAFQRPFDGGLTLTFPNWTYPAPARGGGPNTKRCILLDWGPFLRDGRRQAARGSPALLALKHTRRWWSWRRFWGKRGDLVGVVVASCTGGDFGYATHLSHNQIRRGRTGGGTVGKRLAGNGLSARLHWGGGDRRLG